MATINLQIQLDAGGDPIVASRKMSDTDMGRFLAAYGTAYAVPVMDEESGVEVMTPLTDPLEIVEAIWTGIMAGMAANVESFERDAAARAARDSVTPIDLSAK